MKSATAIVTLALLAAACGSPGSGTTDRFSSEGALPIAPRRMTLVVESCALDSFQLAALEQPAVRKIAHELILVCPTIRLSGEVVPADPDARETLLHTVTRARTLGYTTRLGVTMGDDLASFPTPYSPDRSQAAFGDAAWAAKVATALAPFGDMGDGLELDLIGLAPASRVDVTSFFTTLDAAFRPRVSLGVMAPPSTREPSDTAGGEAFALDAIAPHVDRVRMMTLDFSCCGQGPGPGLDSGWAVDAARFAKATTNGVPVDIAFPLYGTDFSDLGDRFVNYTDGRALADFFGVTPRRAVGGELTFDWIDAAGHAHETWYPDSVTASRVLSAWDEKTLPLDVGVVFYGLGSEDPALWSLVAGGLL